MKIIKEIKWWNLEEAQVLKNLNTSIDGLNLQDASLRLQKSGLNVIGQKNPRTAVKILFEQFKNWLILILLIASALSFFLGENIEGIVIITLVLLSVFFGFIQEFKAEKVIKDLRKFITNKSRVLRDNKWTEIDSSNLIPGDIIEILIGDKIPADVRLLSIDDFQTDESSLTGESLPVDKTVNVLNEESVNPVRLTNMAFMGSIVAQGKATAVVVNTGENTFFGKTSKILEISEPETDFQKQIKNFSLFLFRVIMMMTLFIFISNAILKKELLESFLFALALAVGITPEMLPAIITVTLSQGALKMAKKKVVVKRLMSVEDLGNVDTLCMDKTGTLTEGHFTLDNYLNIEGKKDINILTYALLCTSGIMEKSQNVARNPVDKAIWESVYIQKIKHTVKEYLPLDENEFDYERKRSSVLVEKQDERLLITKGAYESILLVSDSALIKGKIIKIDSEVKNLIYKLIDNNEKIGYRAIVVAKKNFDAKSSNPTDENNMTIIGILLFKDPVKATAKEAIKRFSDLGVNLKVLSGDSLTVTTNIAQEAGIVFDKSEVITGDELEELNPDEFTQICKKVIIFSRVTPEQKYKIVQSLNYEDHIVGFLGDGVNDVAAIKAADVGISVDTGVEIAKDAADIILLEKDIKVLADGIEAGRKTFGNIMKYILNTISANYGNMFTVAISSIFLKFIPLLPSQILLNNFLSDVPLFAVATDNVDANFVKKPKRWNLDFIKSFMIYYGFVSSFFDMLLIIPMILILKVDVGVFRTAWFVESSISEMIVTFAIRTKYPFYKSRPSKWLLILTFCSILFVILMPITKWGAFEFKSLGKYVWILIIFDLISYFTVTEIVKKKFFKKFEREN